MSNKNFHPKQMVAITDKQVPAIGLDGVLVAEYDTHWEVLLQDGTLVWLREDQFVPYFPEQPETALQAMTRKAREGNAKGHRGYVTDLGELRQIMQELTPLVPINVFLNETRRGELDFEVKFSFTLEEDNL